MPGWLWLFLAFLAGVFLSGWVMQLTGGLRKRTAS